MLIIKICLLSLQEEHYARWELMEVELIVSCQGIVWWISDIKTAVFTEMDSGEHVNSKWSHVDAINFVFRFCFSVAPCRQNWSMWVKVENRSHRYWKPFFSESERQSLSIEQRELYAENFDSRQAWFHPFGVTVDADLTVVYDEAVIECGAIIAPIDTNA